MQALEDLSMQYDCSVRNSENTVVQFVYGDDGLNPDKMENNNRPVDLDRVRLSVSQTDPCVDEVTLARSELMDNVEASLSDERFMRMGSVVQKDIRSYFRGLVAKQEELALAAPDKAHQLDRYGWNSCRVTATQLGKMMDIALDKFSKAFVEPGEAVGAIGAQSISEPGTQMTLKVRGYPKFRLALSALCHFVLLFLTCVGLRTRRCRPFTSAELAP
jgi:DNA-directed RNA polymerase III subunit RPC1